MLKIYQLCLIILFLISCVTSATDIHFQIKGLTKLLENNVRTKLSIIETNEVVVDKHLFIKVDSIVRDSLKAMGYYEPTIDFNLYPSSSSGRQVLMIHVVPGKPVLISGTRVMLRGGARTDRDYLDLLSTCPKVGTVLNHGDYDRFKKSLSNLAIQKGYFDSKFIKSQLEIDVKHHQAFWNINYDSGERYCFGEVTFENSQIYDRYLKKLVPFKKGDYYHATYLNELNRRLSAIGWFNSVITLKFDQARKNKVLPLYIVISSYVKNIIEMGIGYSTDMGPRVKAIWEEPLINPYGHSLITSSSISEKEQQLAFNYKVPLIKNPFEQFFLLKGGFKRVNLNNIEQNSTMFDLSRYWNFSSGWKRVTNLHWSFDRFTQADVTDDIMLLYPSVTISRACSHSVLTSTWSNSQRYSIDYSNSVWGSDINFSVIQTENVWICTIYNKHRFVIRNNLGWIETNDFEHVPLDLRFFAGGDCSIRGYKYKSISPKNEKGQLTGASKLVTGSIEYQYNVNEKWWGALFIDSGEAINDIQKSDFKTGIGIGVCWQSPIGAIKFDFAMPICDKNKHNLQFYIGLGPEL